MFKSIFYTAICILIFASCTKSGYDEAVVYNSNFNTGDKTGLDGAILYKYNGANIIGRYNNGGFTLNLANLPKHKAIQIEVVPYFHNSWDGNNNFGGIDGPDIWRMQADGVDIVNATFSNTPCTSMYCLFQSYPEKYAIVNNPPMTDAFKIMSGTTDNCSGINTTSAYKMIRTITHSNATLNLNFRDFLVQTNVPDKLCDESWSIASLVVKVINTN
jgi:hypothetical protein